MRDLRPVAALAATVGGVAWVLKIFIVGIQGGPDAASAPERVAFLTGLGCLAVAAMVVGLELTRERDVYGRALGAAAGLLVFGLVLGVSQGLLTAVPGDSWVQREAAFPALGAVALATVARARARGSV